MNANMQFSPDSIVLMKMVKHLLKDQTDSETTTLKHMRNGSVLNEKNIDETIKELYDRTYKVHVKMETEPDIKHLKPIQINSKRELSIPKTSNSRFMKKPVSLHISKQINRELLYAREIGGRKIILSFFLERVDKISVDVINHYAKLVFLWIDVISQYAKPNCSSRLHIFCYMTSLKKTLPANKTQILNELNINSAFTSSCAPETEIILFRKEEWFKVLIHETFHCFGLDFSLHDNSLITKCIKRIFPIQSSINAYEAYTEFWAEIINAFLCNFSTIANKRDFHKILSSTKRTLDYEREFSLIQLAKIVKYMGVSYSDLYSSTNNETNENNRNIGKKNNGKYREHTNVFAYYILKCIFIFNANDFIEVCKRTNENRLQFKWSVKSQQTLCEFIERKYRNTYFENSLERATIFLKTLENFYIHSKKYNPHIELLINTCRMSICEIR
jgi:hypothetical protein